MFFDDIAIDSFEEPMLVRVTIKEFRTERLITKGADMTFNRTGKKICHSESFAVTHSGMKGRPESLFSLVWPLQGET